MSSKVHKGAAHQRWQVTSSRCHLFHFIAASMVVLGEWTASAEASPPSASSSTESVLAELASKASEELAAILGTSGQAKGAARATPSPLEALDSFCGLALGGQHIRQPMVVDCSCCATFKVGDYAGQVELLFGGHKVNATAREEGGHAVGEVPLWSLGEHVPEVVCHGGPQAPRPMCSCTAKDTTWAEFEPACRTGASCRRERPPEEWPSICPEGVICGARKDQALGRNGGGMGLKRPVVNSGDATQCTAIPPEKSGVQSKGPKVARRVSLGSARCEDMAPEQCHLFYTKAQDGWRHCEATAESVRQCPAAMVTEASARAETDQMEAWAVKNAYLPGAWPVDILDDGTIAAVSKPERQAFMKHIENLPQKIQKNFVI